MASVAVPPTKCRGTKHLCDTPIRPLFAPRANGIACLFCYSVVLCGTMFERMLFMSFDSMASAEAVILERTIGHILIDLATMNSWYVRTAMPATAPPPPGRKHGARDHSSPRLTHVRSRLRRVQVLPPA